MKRIYVVGTADTKGAELAYLRDRIAAAGGDPLVVDVGTRAPTIAVDVSASAVAALHPEGTGAVLGGDDRGTAVKAMADAFGRFVVGQDDIGGIIGIGGGGGTSIVSAGMQKLPIGMPKIMVSTLASGDVAPYVGVSDIIMMPSVTDFAGINRLSRVILNNAAQAITAMVANPVTAATEKPAVGLTMFGVTTTCVTQVVERLEADFDCLVFHATGTGGRTMEALAASGMVAGLLDLTTTEVCDLLFGGVLPAGADRFDVVADKNLPYVGSVGACDMINFWAPDSVPASHADRLFYHHNANVTLMRTNAAECSAIGRFIAEKLDRSTAPLTFLLPEKGVSALDIEGGPFFDPAADAALFAAIEAGIRPLPGRRIERLPLHINDSQFADAAAAAYRSLAR